MSIQSHRRLWRQRGWALRSALPPRTPSSFLRRSPRASEADCGRICCISLNIRRRTPYAVYYANKISKMSLMSYITCHKDRHMETLDLLRAATAARLSWRTRVVPGGGRKERSILKSFHKNFLLLKNKADPYFRNLLSGIFSRALTTAIRVNTDCREKIQIHTECKSQRIERQSKEKHLWKASWTPSASSPVCSWWVWSSQDTLPRCEKARRNNSQSKNSELTLFLF